MEKEKEPSKIRITTGSMDFSSGAARARAIEGVEKKIGILSQD